MKKLWVKKKSSLHGSGLFASANIQKNEQIIEYIGDKVTKKKEIKELTSKLIKQKKIKKMEWYISLSLIKNMTLMEEF